MYSAPVFLGQTVSIANSAVTKIYGGYQVIQDNKKVVINEDDMKKLLSIANKKA